METKTQYRINIRLDPKAAFRPLEIRNEHATFEAAQERVRAWYTLVGDLPRAKPEAVIEAVELPHLGNCRNCGHSLFKFDIGYFKLDGVYCYDCSIKLKLCDGFYDEVVFSLDKLTINSADYTQL